MMKPKTYHDGAFEERKAFLRKLRRALREISLTYDAVERDMLMGLIAWVKARHRRYGARKGGL